MDARTLAIPFALAACTSAAPSSDAPDGVGRVVLALDTDACVDYCVSEVRAEIYRDGELGLPLGPAIQAACGESLAFEALPAGTRVRLNVRLFDDTGDLVLEGESDAVTVVADDETAATIHVRSVAPPTITGVSPDPVIAASGAATVTISGQHLGSGLGAAYVTLDDMPLVGVDWATLAVPIARDTPGGALVVASCGITSSPWPLRVIGSTLGVDAVVEPPGCDGRRAVAIASDDGGVMVAWACGDPSKSYVQRYVADAAKCPLAADSVWTLGAAPTALAPGWVGLATGGVGRFDVSRSGSVEPAAPAESNVVVTALVSSASGVFGIADGRVVRVDAAFASVAAVDASLDALALATSDDVLVLADADGEGRLVEIGTAIVRVVPECRGPRALAVAGALAVMACDSVVIIDRTAQTRKKLDDVASVVAFDARGDVAFAWEPGAGVSVVDARAGTRLHRWEGGPSVAGTPLLATLSSGLVAAGSDGGALTVWAPYDGGGPCR